MAGFAAGISTAAKVRRVQAVTRRYDHTTGQTEWETPPRLFARLNDEFGFTLDVAARAGNSKCQRYCRDGLAECWTGRVFCNPPYGRGLIKWIDKALAERAHCELIVLLLPARTDTRWWHRCVMRAEEVRLTEDRVYFISPETRKPRRAPFGAAIVILGKRDTTPKFSSYRLPKE